MEIIRDVETMRVFDFFLTLLIPSLILVNLLVAPYTKVEESFNLQATHDILVYSTPTHNIGARLRANYDHFEFPGAVPRTFVGAVALAGVSRPVLQLIGGEYGQLVVRAVLGLFNAFALLRYKDGVDKAFGKAVGRWYNLLQASQFHIIYYASRTLPNMFAFGLCTLAFRELLPMLPSSSKGLTDEMRKRHSLAIYFFVLAGIVFRSEIALLLGTQLLHLIQSLNSLQTIIPIGLTSAVIALTISIPIDSYFWQRPIWPELVGFFYNAIQGKSADWGISPLHSYFTSFLPKLLLNPMIPLLLIPSALYFPATRRSALGLTVPSLAFIAIYSLQPHKEARFIIYTVPPLTACAALGAHYISTRRSRSTLNQLLTWLIILSIIGSFAASIFMLGISSLNYPGGEALFRLHKIVRSSNGIISNSASASQVVNVHMDVLACMTGVSRFQQDHPTPPFTYYLTYLIPLLPTSFLAFHNSTATTSHTLDDNNISPAQSQSQKIIFKYDKTEDATTLLHPAFWARFDYVLAERLETVVGKWEVVDTVYGYAGMEVLRPGQVSGSMGKEGEEGRRVWEQMGGDSVRGEDKEEDGRVYSALARDDIRDGGERDSRKLNDITIRDRFLEDVGRFGLYGAIREEIRWSITKGWWIGPRMEAKIRILKRAP